ncbi:hypothetical protein LTR28_003269, partial [Elasticomyces elasticus]
MTLPSLALPGQSLGPSTKYLPGPGTHIDASTLVASIAGIITTIPPPPKSASTTLPTLSVSRPASSAPSLSSVGTIVLAK